MFTPPPKISAYTSARTEGTSLAQDIQVSLLRPHGWVPGTTSLPLHLQSLLPLPLPSMNLEAAGVHLAHGTMSSSGRWKTRGSQALQGERRSYMTACFICGHSVRVDVNAARSALAVVIGALDWQQLLLFPNPESVA